MRPAAWMGRLSEKQIPFGDDNQKGDCKGNEEITAKSKPFQLRTRMTIFPKAPFSRRSKAARASAKE